MHNPIIDYTLGEALSTKGNFQEAELWCRKSLESKPTHIPAFLALAKLVSRSPERSTEADDLYKKAMELEPKNADIYIHYGKNWRVPQLWWSRFSDLHQTMYLILYSIKCLDYVDLFTPFFLMQPNI